MELSRKLQPPAALSTVMQAPVHGGLFGGKKSLASARSRRTYRQLSSPQCSQCTDCAVPIQYDACNYLTAAANWSSFNGQQVQMSILTTSCGHPIGSTIKRMASCHTKQWRCVTRRQAGCYHTQLSIPVLAYGFVTPLSYWGLKG